MRINGVPLVGAPTSEVSSFTLSDWVFMKKVEIWTENQSNTSKDNDYYNSGLGTWQKNVPKELRRTVWQWDVLFNIAVGGQRKSRAVHYSPSGPSWPVLGWTLSLPYCCQLPRLYRMAQKLLGSLACCLQCYVTFVRCCVVLMVFLVNNELERIWLLCSVGGIFSE
jgi:hypothetical protein